MSEFLDRLSSVFFPKHCPLCDAVVDHDTLWCGRCEVPWYEPLSRPLDEEREWFLTGAYSPLRYDGGAREAVIDLKEHHDRRKVLYFGQVMAEALGKLDIGVFDLVVPVPAKDSELVRKGFDAAEKLAVKVGEQLMLTVRRDLIERSEESVGQHTLSARERLENADRSYRVRKGKELGGERVLLVDDVFTTGSTANACAKTLLSCGASEVAALTATVAVRQEGEKTEEESEC